MDKQIEYINRKTFVV